MRRTFPCLLLLVLLALPALPVEAHHPIEPGQQATYSSGTIPLYPAGTPGSLYEITIKMNRSDKLWYRFAVSDGVAVWFNIHSHPPGEVVVYQYQSDSSGEEGNFTAPANGEYYLTWVNNGTDGVLVGYQYKKTPRPVVVFETPWWYLPVTVGAAAAVAAGFTGWSLKRPSTAAPPAKGRRTDLLERSWVRRLCRSRGALTGLRLLFLLFLLFIIIAGFLGYQEPARNPAVHLTWTFWWILLIFLILFLGKAWCLVCPWRAISEWLTARPFGTPRWKLFSLNLKWPSRWKNIYPATALFLGLTWLELGWGVTTVPWATAALGVLMLLVVVVPAFVFERDSFCRYGCLVGRISGIYAMLSPLEIRAKDRAVCARCGKKWCINGGKGGLPCPTFQYLGAMERNTYCILCGECIRTCRKGNVALNLRPPGSDLIESKLVRKDEGAMILVMLSMTLFHGLTMTPEWEGLLQDIEFLTGLPRLASFTLGMAMVLLVTAGVYWFFTAAAARAGGAPRSETWAGSAYTMVPAILMYHLSHNLHHLLMEAVRVFPALDDPFGRGWNLLPGWPASPPPLLDMGPTLILQTLLLFAGLVWSLHLIHRARVLSFPLRPRAARAVLAALAVLFIAVSFWLTGLPMTARTGL